MSGGIGEKPHGCCSLGRQANINIVGICSTPARFAGWPECPRGRIL